MSRAIAVVLALSLLAAVGCSNPMHFFRMEEYGEGWKLHVDDKGTSVLPKWVKGENRSVKLLNYHEAPSGAFYVINTLYLELTPDGKVARGFLKRWSTPEFDRRKYFEGRAEWFRVISGTCRLDAELNGYVEALCEGSYSFSGDVVPDDEMKIIKPE